MTLEEIQQQLESLQDEELNKFEKQIVKSLKKLEELIVVNLVQDIKNPLEYDFVMQKYLEESGYYKAINNLVDNGFDVVYPSVSGAFAAGGISIIFGAEDLAKINSLKQLTFEKYNALAGESIATLKESLYKYSLSNMTTSQIANEMKSSLVGTNLAKYSSTYAETVISDYTQSVIDFKSSEATEGVWIYKGVNDLKTRPFCKCLLNKKYYYDNNEKSKLQFDSRRRWRCRHIFLKVSKDYAESNGYAEGSPSC